MLPGRKFTPDEILRILIRRRWLVLLPFAIGLAAAPLIARKVPKLYRSEALIMVVPQRVPDSYVRSTVTAGVEDRLPALNDHILSRSRLERIILEFDLYKKERASSVMEDVVRRMRADITVPPLTGRDVESFSVSYVNEDPETAQKVTARLASLYQEENARDRGNLAESTSQFLEVQLEEAKAKLIEHERKLEAYRRRYAGELPSQLDSNLQAIQSAQLQLQSITDTANRARERRLLIERQMADAQMLPVIQVPASAQGPEAQAAVPAAQQLEAAEAQLSRLLLRYKPDHPDVRALERQIAELRAQAAEEALAAAGGTPVVETLSPAEVARQKRIHDLQAELDVIDRQLATAQAEEAQLRARIAEYQAKVEAVPTRESELVELTRDYGTLQANYESLLKKREESKLAADLERRQIGEQFRIVDPASLPAEPYNQKERILFIFSGAVAGLLLGLGVGGVLEFFDSTLKVEGEVAAALNLPVLALVPALASDRERRRQRLKRVAADLAGVAVLAGCVAVLAVWRLQL